MEIKYTKDEHANSACVEVYLTARDITDLLERGAVGVVKAGGYLPGKLFPEMGLIVNVREV